MPPSRTPLTMLVVGSIAILSLALLVLAALPAASESIDIYEFETITSQHGARAVSVRADGAEAIVLESVYNDTTRVYTNHVFTYDGSTMTERGNWTGQGWYWTAAAHDPNGVTALLGGTSGILYTYSQGTLRQVTGLPYSVNVIDWHPTNHNAYIGVSTSRLYRFFSGSVTLETSTASQVTDLDVSPTGGEIVLSSYYYVEIYNLTLNNLRTLERPVGTINEFYYCYAVEYSNDGRFFVANWYDWNSYTMFRYSADKWIELGTSGTNVYRVRYENEGSFALLAMSNNLQYLEGGAVQAVSDWYQVGASRAWDMDYNLRDLYFLVGTDNSVVKFKRKANVKPWLTRPIPDFNFDEDVPDGGEDLIDLLNYVRDDRSFEKLRFEFDYQQDTDLVEGSIQANYLDFEQKVPNWNGKMSFRLKVWDSGFNDIAGDFDDMFNRTNMFNVTVRQVNDPVTLVTIGDKEVDVDDLVYFLDESEWLNLTIVTHDVDNDMGADQPARFSLNRTLPSMKVKDDTSILSFLPRNKDVGTLQINLTVTDGFGSSDYAHLTFHVRNMNNPPKLLGVKDMEVDEDRWLNFTISARDEDLEIGMPDIITFSTNRTDGMDGDDLPNLGFVVDPEDHTSIHVSFLPTNEDVGVVMVEFRVRDGFAPLGTWQDRRSMAITVVNANDAPVLLEANGVDVTDSEVLRVTATEDNELRVELTADDDDRDPLVFYVDDARFKLSQPGGGYGAYFTYTPTNDQVGNVLLTVSVWDVHNTYDELLINISVMNVNDPPVILRFEARDATDEDEMAFDLYEDVLFTAPLLVEDIDSTYLDISDSEGILTIVVDHEDPHRAVVSFTPGQGDIGTVQTSLIVYDGDGDNDVLDLVLVINGTNDLPGTPTVAQLGGEASLTILLQATSVNDPDGDELTYVWDFGDHSALRSGVDLVQVEHRYPRSGTYILTLTVDDGNGGTRSVQHEVIVPQVDEQPVDTEVEEGPVALVALLIMAFTVVALLFTYLYWTLPRRRNG